MKSYNYINPIQNHMHHKKHIPHQEMADSKSLNATNEEESNNHLSLILLAQKMYPSSTYQMRMQYALHII